MKAWRKASRSGASMSETVQKSRSPSLQRTTELLSCFVSNVGADLALWAGAL